MTWCLDGNRLDAVSNWYRLHTRDRLPGKEAIAKIHLPINEPGTIGFYGIGQWQLVTSTT